MSFSSPLYFLTLLLAFACGSLHGEVITPGTPLNVGAGIRGAVELTFQSEVGVHYQVEFSADLFNWDAEGYSIKGTGGRMSVLVSTRNQTSAYYRLRNDGNPLNIAPVGPVGPSGPTGATGLTGATGATGSRGPAGLQGVRGKQGIRGPQGTPGASTSGKAGKEGPAGPRGRQGPVGPQGVVGLTGPPGPQGSVGPIGPAGPQGLTGPPGQISDTTGALGIGYYDDFTGKPNGTLVGKNYKPDFGTPYEFYMGGGTVPSVSGGVLSSPTPGVWYLGQELKNPVRSFGAQVRFDSQNPAAGGYDVAVFLIMPENIFLDKLIHIRFSRIGLGVDVSTGSGVSGFVNLLNINHANTGGNGNGVPPIGQAQTLTGAIVNDTLWLSWLGRTYTVKDPRIASVNGKWIFFEQYSPGSGNSDYVKWLRVWANSPDISTLPGVAVRPASGATSSLMEAFGQGQFERKLLVGSSDQSLINNNNSLVVRGNSEVQRLVANANAGAAGTAGTVGGTTRVITTPSSNPGGSSLTDLTSTLMWGGTLNTAGDRWVGKYMGTFAANSNAKRVAFELAGLLLFDSGNLPANNEPWELEVTLYRTATTSHNGFFKFTCPSKTLMASTSDDFTGAPVVGASVKGAGVSAADVVLKYGHESFFPAPQ